MNETPGSWAVEIGSSPTGGGDFEGYVVVNAGEGTLKRQIAYLEPAETDEEQEANGRLMAASKDLRDALKALADKVAERFGEAIKYEPVAVGQYLDAAYAALRKAEATV